MSTAVVYLARHAEGPEAVREFLSSYREHPAGAAHDLVIIEKGFPEFFSLCEAGMIDETVQTISISDDGFDLTAYRIAAETLTHEKVFFLNTFSKILAPDWLAKFEAAYAEPDVAIVGATGSYQSLNSSYREISKTIWLCQKGIPYDPVIEDEWRDELVKHAPAWLNKSRLQKATGRLRRRLGLSGYNPALDKEFDEFWAMVSGPGGIMEYYVRFPEFPNPHVRSNAFMVSREDLLTWLPADIKTKEKAYLVESGPDSLTILATRAGRRAVLVGADGRVFDPPDWPKSRTFRLGQQSNILVADNQTSSYDAMTKRQKLLFTKWTWGTLDQFTEEELDRDASPHPRSPPRRSSWPQFSKGDTWFGENSFGIHPLDATGAYAPKQLRGITVPL